MLLTVFAPSTHSPLMKFLNTLIVQSPIVYYSSPLAARFFMKAPIPKVQGGARSL